MKNYTIDLTEGLKDPAKAKAVVKKVQDVIDELVLANTEALNVAKDANTVAEDFRVQVVKLNETISSLTNVIKSMHTVLGSKTDLFKEDAGMQELMGQLGKFIMSSSAVKLGVLDSSEKL